jgi:hypothetical protein
MHENNADKIFSELESNWVGQWASNYLVSLEGKVVRSYPDLTRKNYLLMQFTAKNWKGLQFAQEQKQIKKVFILANRFLIKFETGFNLSVWTYKLFQFNDENHITLTLEHRRQRRHLNCFIWSHFWPKLWIANANALYFIVFIVLLCNCFFRFSLVLHQHLFRRLF